MTDPKANEMMANCSLRNRRENRPVSTPTSPARTTPRAMAAGTGRPFETPVVTE